MNFIRNFFKTKPQDYSIYGNSYTGASRHKTSFINYNPLGVSADGAIKCALPKLRERSRDLVRNNSVAISIVELIELGVLGGGLKLNANIDNELLKLSDDEVKEQNMRIEREFNLWAESKFCDSERQLNFYGLQKMALRQKLENGETLALLTQRVSFRPIDTCINMIESDLLATPPHLINDATIYDGVRKDNYGAPVSYFFKGVKNTLPTGIDPYLAYAYDYKEILTYDNNNLRQILHIFKKTRPGQTRGVPFLAPVIEDILQLGRYSDSELMAAVITSNITTFISDNTGVTPLSNPYGDINTTKNDDHIELGAGTVIELSGNRKIDVVNPVRPNAQFEPFFLAKLKIIAMGIGLPFEILLHHFSSSYSASQGALLEANKFFKAARQDFLEEFILPIYERFFIDAVNAGRISAPNFFDDLNIRKAYLSAEWIAPAKGMIDELKEVKAAELRVNMGISTLKKEAAMHGGNFDRIIEQRAREYAKMKALGLLPDVKTEKDIEEDEKNNNE